MCVVWELFGYKWADETEQKYISNVGKCTAYWTRRLRIHRLNCLSKWHLWTARATKKFGSTFLPMRSQIVSSISVVQRKPLLPKSLFLESHNILRIHWNWHPEMVLSTKFKFEKRILTLWPDCANWSLPPGGLLVEFANRNQMFPSIHWFRSADVGSGNGMLPWTNPWIGKWIRLEQQ